MSTFEILDTEGRLIGLANDPPINRALWHGDFLQIDICGDPVDFCGAMGDRREIASVLRIHLQLWEVKMIDPQRGRLNSRWYLIAREPMPELAWKSAMFTDLRPAFRDLKT